VEHLETVRVTKDGRRLDVSVTVSPVKDQDGQIIGISKIIRDITERKRAEEDTGRIGKRPSGCLRDSLVYRGLERTKRGYRQDSFTISGPVSFSITRLTNRFPFWDWKTLRCSSRPLSARRGRMWG
jgi:hypothetical protein